MGIPIYSMEVQYVGVLNRNELAFAMCSWLNFMMSRKKISLIESFMNLVEISPLVWRKIFIHKINKAHWGSQCIELQLPVQLANKWVKKTWALHNKSEQIITCRDYQSTVQAWWWICASAIYIVGRGNASSSFYSIRTYCPPA